MKREERFILTSSPDSRELQPFLVVRAGFIGSAHPQRRIAKTV
jgi:hypothetical protein